MATAKDDPALIAELGSPIEPGWYVTGSISSTGQNSYAEFSIPIHGPKNSGTLHVIALKSPLVKGMEDWKINVLEAKIAGRSDPIFPGAPHYGDPVRREVDAVPANPGAPGIRSGVVGGVPNASADEPPPPSPSSSRITAPISGGVLNGKAIKLPQPAYPPIAKAAKAGGTVVVQILLDENGNVISAHAVSGHPLLKASAEAAAREARFTPTKLSGQAVKVSGVLTYNFVQP